MQDCWFTAELYGVHYLKGVYAVTNKAVFSMGCRAAMVQAACTGSQALLLVKIVGSQQSFMGCNTSIAVTNKAGASSMQMVLSIVAVQQCWATAELYGVQHLTGVNAVTNKAVSSMGCRAALVQ